MGHETVLFISARLLAVGALLLLARRVRAYTRRSRKNSRRGRDLISTKKAIRAERKSLGGESDGLPFGGRTLPSSAATSHFLVLGTTGSGKTLTISGLMNKALGGVAPGSNHRALVYDAKQEVMETLNRLDLSCDVFTINPFDARCAAWDIAADVTSPATALQVATNHIPVEEGKNRFFSDAPRHLFYGAMLSFIARARGRWEYSDLIYCASSRDRLEAVLKHTDYGRELIADYFSEDRTANNIMSSLRSYLMPFEVVAAAWSRAEKKVSLRNWVEQEFVLVLGNDESARTAIDAINRVIFQRASELLLAQSESPTRRSWIFLDEVSEAGFLASLPRVMNKIRSKGGCVVIGLQELAGLKEVYGENGAATIVANANNKALLRVESPESAEWASKMIGGYEEVEIMRSENMSDLFGFVRLNRSRSENRVRGDTVLPSEFFSIPQTNRENGLTGYFLTPHIGAFRATVPADVIDSWLPSRGSGSDPEPDFVPRPESDQYLEPWDDADCERLELSLEQELLEEDQEQTELPVALGAHLPEELVH